MNKALDKILVRHRNTKIFLFMLSGPFFLTYMVVKYSIKVIVILYLYRKNKKKQALKAKLEQSQSLATA